MGKLAILKSLRNLWNWEKSWLRLYKSCTSFISTRLFQTSNFISKKGIAIQERLHNEFSKELALHSLGASYYFASQYEEALACYNSRQHKLSPKSFKTFRQNYVIASIFYRQGKLKESHEIAQRLFENGSAVGDSFTIALSLNIQAMSSFHRIDSNF